MTSAPRLDRIGAALAALFPPGVSVAAVALAAADPGSLLPPERAAMTGAVPHRLTEFAAGRQAARAALAELGLAPATALPMGEDRAPVWPPGISGSIAHAAGIAVAVTRRGAPLGVDVEDDAPLAPELWPVITSADERAALPPGDRSRQVRLIFAAKEAVFKAQSPDNRAVFGFEAVRVTLANGGFDATFLCSAGDFAAGERLYGKVVLVEGLVLAGVAR